MTNLPARPTDEIQGCAWDAATQTVPVDGNYASDAEYRHLWYIARDAALCALEAGRPVARPSMTDQELKPFTHSVPGHWSTDRGTVMANTYLAKTRDQLSMPDVPDLVVANGVFIANPTDPDLIFWQTAAKERIRWLSAQLAARDIELEALRTRADTDLTRKLRVAEGWQLMETAPVGGYIIVGGEGEDGWLMLRIRHEEGHDPAAWCLGHDDCGDPVFATHWRADVLGTPYASAADIREGE